MTAQEPISGEQIPANWFNQLWRDVQAAANIHGDGKNIVVSHDKNGINIRFVGNVKTGTAGKTEAAAVELMKLISIPQTGAGTATACKCTIAPDGTVTPIAGSTVSIILPEL